ncbi:cyclohexanone monooxygenase [Oceanicola sp. 22II-s10i]|uniref:flavin-containing monooxygenase n=1 Tax=Oceanicola sp. 22II-s10i TaxID=1317116 RepID=UPI000B52127D|nr:NAD(P)/FAD-dependent oxidoreductase [Oceanicola sp. 22II-s10i]OWU80799.1 cyclohexanone monooxygenase [Oceanicola sp. 22II-s10i]
MTHTNTHGGDVDAIVIGAGFGGLYQVKKLRDDLGLKVQAYDDAPGVGGTWHWNRYPGALSDTPSHVYRYAFDKELLQESTWETTYLTQPEILTYLNRFADKYDLRRSFQFDTRVTAAHFDEATNLWTVTTNKGDTVKAKYIVCGLGLLSAINTPDIKGIGNFKGELIHTGQWPEGVDLKGKRIGVIGTGSTGQQVITATAPLAEHLTVFQRTPQYNVPVGNRPQSPEEITEIKKNYDAIWDQVFSSGVAFGFEESTIPAMSVSEEERDRIFQEAWDEGGGFRFMFATFCDIATDEAANKAAQKFITTKIKQIVKDPKTAELLTPTDLYAKRPLCGHNYFEVYNRDNVSLINVKRNPIEEITETGIRLADGTECELDILILATGFDAVEGNYMKIDFRGRGGVTLADRWKDGPDGYLGVSETGFPNFFMILGPNGPFTNLPPSIETQVEWISDAIKYIEDNDIAAFDPKPSAEEEWLETCRTIAGMTLFPKAESWIFGANVPGKKNAVRFYLGGLVNYRAVLKEVADSGYASFEQTPMPVAAE